MRYGREFWQELSAEVDGGSTVAEVARRYRVQPRTLSWWRWRLKKVTPSGPLLLPVVVRRPRAVATPASALEIQVSDLIIRIDAETDVGYVARLVAALRVGC